MAIATTLLDQELRRQLAGALRQAPARGELAIHYQPRVHPVDGRRLGAEALLRWRHARYGQVPPNTFIPIAEGSNLILALGGWVLRQAMADAARHPELGRVSINVSVRQVLSGRLPAQVATALAESGLPPERLELELTETLPLGDMAEAAAMLGRLRDCGIGIALDDFGAGYGSFQRLRELPFSTIKLDRSLIARLPEDAKDFAILWAIRDLARSLRLRLVAEGVERPEQLEAAIGLGFDEVQGFLLGRPAPLEALVGPTAPMQPGPAAAHRLLGGGPALRQAAGGACRPPDDASPAIMLHPADRRL
ncbi:EAL domain-containing protein [Roseicella frigidaeris]|nr:EAL domain-containing protein [Roseicella frigidaeris]